MAELTWQAIEAMKRKLRNKARLLIKNTRDWTDGKGVITRDTDSHDTITHERTVEAQLRTEVDLRPHPLIEHPNKYAGKKKCNECQEYLFLCNFSADKRNVDGKQGICKDCHAKLKRENYAAKKWKR